MIGPSVSKPHHRLVQRRPWCIHQTRDGSDSSSDDMPLLQQLDTWVSGLPVGCGRGLPVGCGRAQPAGAATVGRPFLSTASTHPYSNPMPICTSWNAGPCRFRDSCQFRHVCSSCFRQGHRAIECRWGEGGGGGTPRPMIPVRSNSSAGGNVTGRTSVLRGRCSPRPGVEGHYSTVSLRTLA